MEPPLISSSAPARSSPTRRSLRHPRHTVAATLTASLAGALACAWLALSAEVAAAARGEAGLPLLASSRGRELARDGGHVDAQMFAFEQDSRGLLYVANNAGVLVFDGSRWRTVPVAGDATVLSLAVATDDTVYVGASGTFGRLAPNERGEPAYEALDTLNEEGSPEVGDVWDTLILGDAVLFRTPAAIYRYESAAITVVLPRRSWQVARAVHGQLWASDAGTGLMKIGDDGSVALAPGGERLAEQGFLVMLPLDPARILLGTATDGLYLYDPRPDTSEAQRLVRFASAANPWLAENQLYSGTLLPGRRIALGTLRGGAVVLDGRGDVEWHAARRHGLPDDTVLATFTDAAGDLWLGFHDGLSLVETANGLSHFGDASGLPGFVEAVARSQGRIYAAGALGLRRLQTGATALEGSEFDPVSGIEHEVWSLLDRGDTLLAAAGDGVYEIRGLASRRLLEGESYSLTPSADGRRVWVGQNNGIAWLEPKTGGSPSSGRLAAVEKPVRRVVQTSADRLWVSTELGDFLRVDLEANGVAGTARQYGPKDGLPGTVAHPLVLGDDLLVAARGFFRYDAARDRFEADPRFPDTFAGAHGLALCPLADGTLVASADHRTLHLVPGSTAFEQPGSIVERVPLGNRMISCLAEDSIVWLGTDDGLFRWDREAETQGTDYAAVQLRSIALGGLGVLAADLGAGAMSLQPIPWRSAPLRVEFSLPSLVAADRNEYRTLLEGFESEWTPWNRLGWRELTVLPPGRYRLRVEARNVRREPARAATLDFTITPPWYRSGVAYAGYGLLAVAGLVGAGRLQVSQIRRRNLELQRTVEDRTEELRAASITDPLTGLHNRRFFAEIIDAEIAAAARAQRRSPRRRAGAALLRRRPRPLQVGQRRARPRGRRRAPAPDRRPAACHQARGRPALPLGRRRAAALGARHATRGRRRALSPAAPRHRRRADDGRSRAPDSSGRLIAPALAAHVLGGLRADAVLRGRRARREPGRRAAFRGRGALPGEAHRPQSRLRGLALSTVRGRARHLGRLAATVRSRGVDALALARVRRGTQSDVLTPPPTGRLALRFGLFRFDLGLALLREVGAMSPFVGLDVLEATLLVAHGVELLACGAAVGGALGWHRSLLVISAR